MEGISPLLSCHQPNCTPCHKTFRSQWRGWSSVKSWVRRQNAQLVRNSSLSTPALCHRCQAPQYHICALATDFRRLQGSSKSHQSFVGLWPLFLGQGLAKATKGLMCLWCWQMSLEEGPIAGSSKNEALETNKGRTLFDLRFDLKHAFLLKNLLKVRSYWSILWIAISRAQVSYVCFDAPDSISTTVIGVIDIVIISITSDFFCHFSEEFYKINLTQHIWPP